MWYASPQLYFTCALRPKNGRKPKNANYKTDPDDTMHSFVCFSTFEVLDLPIKGRMEDAGVTKQEPHRDKVWGTVHTVLVTPASPTPCLYVAPAAYMAGRVPLPPFFSLETQLQRSLTCSARARIQASRMAVPTQLLLTEGSNVYKVNLWLWSFARGKPRLGGLSVEKTFDRPVAANEASKERAAENRRRRKADKA